MVLSILDMLTPSWTCETCKASNSSAYATHGVTFPGKAVGQTSQTYGHPSSENSCSVSSYSCNQSHIEQIPSHPDMSVSAHGDDDGVFWIAFEDMLRYFDCIDVCKVRRGWSEVRVTGVLPPLSSKSHQSCTLLTVLEPTEVEFSLFQEGQRYAWT